MALLVGSVVALLLASTTALLTPTHQATPVPDPTPIPPVVWELRSIVVAGEQTAVGNPSAYTVQFLPNGELRLRADCNQGSGPYRLAGQTFAAGPFRTTRMRCRPSSLDQAFLRGLETATTWSSEDGRLVLGDPAVELALDFVPRLAGVVWEWQGFQGGNDREVVPGDPTAYTVEFLGAGQFVLRADCNGGGGPYEAAGPTVDLRLAVISEAVCEDPATDREFLRIVEEASSFVFENGDLVLALPADAGTARFTARPITEEGAATPAAG